jgi:hypothetical protein
MLAASALDVALVSAFAAVAAAVATPLASWFVAIAHNRHERWVTTYADRRDAYIGLLRTVYRRHLTLSALMAHLKQTIPRSTKRRATR